MIFLFVPVFFMYLYEFSYSNVAFFLSLLRNPHFTFKQYLQKACLFFMRQRQLWEVLITLCSRQNHPIHVSVLDFGHLFVSADVAVAVVSSAVVDDDFELLQLDTLVVQFLEDHLVLHRNKIVHIVYEPCYLMKLTSIEM